MRSRSDHGSFDRSVRAYAVAIAALLLACGGVSEYPPGGSDGGGGGSGSGSGSSGSGSSSGSSGSGSRRGGEKSVVENRHCDGNGSDDEQEKSIA